MIVRRNYGKNHGYLIDGKKAMGVTTAIGKGVAKELTGWAAGVAGTFCVDHPDEVARMVETLGREQTIQALKRMPNAQRDAAADRGSLVHAANESLIKGEAVEVANELRPYVDSSLKFMNDWQPRPLLIEKVVGSYKWGYAGTFDAVVEMKGQCWLIDYKTSASGIWGETALQLAAYRYADCYVADTDHPGANGSAALEIPMSEVGIERCAAVWIRPDGYDLIPLECEQRQFDTFLHALCVARRAPEMKSWVGAAIYPETFTAS